MHVSYENLWNWYVNVCRTRVFEPIQDVTMRVLERNQPAVRYNRRSGQVDGPFITRNMQAFRVPSHDPLLSSPCPLRFENGLFLVVEKAVVDSSVHGFQQANAKKAAYFVFPTLHSAIGRVTADHLSFVWDSNDQARPVHLHATEYFPLPNQNTRGAFYAHHNNYLPASFELSNNADAMMETNIFKGYCATNLKHELFRVISRPYHFPMTHHHTTTGGATRRQIRFPTDGLSALQQVWLRIPTITEMRIMVCRHNHLATVTVFIGDTRPFQQGRLNHAFAFDCRFHETFNRDSLYGMVAQWMNRLQYDEYDFVTNPEFEDDHDDD